MTQPPDWWSQLSPGIHNAPARAGGELILPFAWQQLEQIVRFFVDAWLAKVAVALGAIEIFGWSPYAALVGLGQEFQAAKDNWDTIFAELSVGDISGLLNWLNHIPGEVIDGITVIEQQILNAIAAALGHPAPPDATPTDILAYLQAFPADLITGAFNLGNVQIGTTSLDDIFSGTGQFIGVLNSAATGALNTALTVGGTSLSTLFTNINSSGQLLLSGATGALNTAVTIGGQAVSSLFNGSGQFIGVINSAATGALNGAVTFGGTALSTLLGNINSSGQFLGSAITGAINTAATVAGTAIGTVATNANAAVTNINSLISGVSGSVIADVSTAINTAATNAQGVVSAVNNAAAGVVSGASSLLADATTNIQALFGGAPQYLQGLSAGVFGQSQTNAAYAAAAAASAAQAAEQTRINSAFNAVFNVSPATAGNINQTIDFTSMANQSGMSGIMLPGTGSGSNYIGVTSGQAMWQGGVSGATIPTGDLEVFPTVTTSDYQVITVTLGALNDTTTTTGLIFLVVARCNSARDTYVSMALQQNGGGTFQVQLRYCVSGSEIYFGTGSVTANIPTASVGGVIKWIVGDPSSSSPYAMQVLYNGTPIITYTDSSHVSQVGTSYRYVGLGGWVSSSRPGKYPVAIKTVNYQDNPPAPASYPFSGTPTAGTKGRMYVSNDVGLIQRDNGSAWERVWGGPLGWMTAPPTTGWSAVNAGTATFAADKDAMLLTAPSVASGETHHTWVRTLSPSSNYIARFYIESTAMIFGTTIFSITLRDSSNSRITNFSWGVDTADVGVGFGDSSGWFINVHTRSGTTFNSVLRNSAVRWMAGGGLPNWWQIRDDGSVRYYEYSINGVEFETFYSEPRTTWVTPNQIGFSAFNGNSGYPIYLRVRSLSGIS